MSDGLLEELDRGFEVVVVESKVIQIEEWAGDACS